MFVAFAVAALFQAAASDLRTEVWPTIRPGRVTSTPDWSDYRIYPMAARKKEQEGRVLPELLVGSDGRPKACRILESSKFAELDAGSCRLMMEMKFEPALDANGKPTLSTYSRPLIWMLNSSRPFGSTVMKAHVSNSGGRQRSCSIIGGQGPYVSLWSTLGCLIFSDVQFYFGVAAQKSLDATIDVRLDAGDGAPFLSEPLPAGDPLAIQRITFVVDNSGDPVGCTLVQNQGFGARGMNNLSPCGGLLSNLWFQVPKGLSNRHGTIETRVYVVNDYSK